MNNVMLEIARICHKTNPVHANINRSTAVRLRKKWGDALCPHGRNARETECLPTSQWVHHLKITNSWDWNKPPGSWSGPRTPCTSQWIAWDGRHEEQQNRKIRRKERRNQHPTYKKTWKTHSFWIMFQIVPRKAMTFPHRLVCFPVSPRNP